MPGTESYEPWMQLLYAVAFVISAGVLAAFTQWRASKSKPAEDEKRAMGQAAATAGAMVAIAPAAGRLTEQVLVETLASLRMAVELLVDKLEAEAKERAETEKEELWELRRTVREIRDKEARVRSGGL